MLQRAVASAQAQTESRIEIFISDNASTDETEYVLKRLAEKDLRIRYAKNFENKGMVYNWNQCLAEAKAPLMCLLNDDDILDPRAIEIGCSLLERHRDAMIVFGAVRHCKDSGSLIKVNRPFNRECVLDPVKAHKTIWLRNCFQLSHAVFRVAAARAIGGFNDEVGWCTDTDFNLRLSARGFVAFSPQEMGTYIVHSGQLTSTDNRQVYRWQRNMVEHVMDDVWEKPELAALRTLAERGYLSSYTVYFAAAALRRGQTEKAREFLALTRALGLPISKKHATLYILLIVSLILPGGEKCFKTVVGPLLARLAVRLR